MLPHRHEVALGDGEAGLEGDQQRVVSGELRSRLGRTAPKRLFVEADHRVRYLEQRTPVDRRCGDALRRVEAVLSAQNPDRSLRQLWSRVARHLMTILRPHNLIQS